MMLAQPDGGPLIALTDVSRVYPDGTVGLDRVSLEITRGEWIAVMGPSGSGKSTLLNILGGLDRPTSGQVLISGRDLSRLEAPDLLDFRRRTIGLVFQQFHLIPYLTALENVCVAQHFHSVVDLHEARRALEEVGMGERLDHRPAQLSGGERQRVCIARALINDPQVVLADEPTGSLDETNEELVLAILRRLNARGTSIVLVTHDPLVGRLAGRRIHLAHGRRAQDLEREPAGRAPETTGDPVDRSGR